VSKVKLKIAVAEHPHTSAIRSGEIQIEGVDADIVTVKPQIGAFRRMVRDLEFDVCEIAPTTYIIARAYGKKFKALPILSSAAFTIRACWCARCGDQDAQGSGRQERRRACLFGHHRRVDAPGADR
jgi:hypothetical protein